MRNPEEKLSAMQAELTAEVRAAAEALRAGTDAEERRRLEEYEALLRSAAEKRRAAAATDAHNREDRRIVAESLRLRRELLEAREACAAEIMDELRRRVAELTASPEYPALLADMLRRALAAVPGAGSAQVLLRPADMCHAQALAGAGGGTALSFAEGAFSMGGLMLECAERSRRVDLSYDSALADLEGRFSETTGFSMEGEDGI